jgi:hypothetical protein
MKNRFMQNIGNENRRLPPKRTNQRIITKMPNKAAVKHSLQYLLLRQQTPPATRSAPGIITKIKRSGIVMTPSPPKYGMYGNAIARIINMIPAAILILSSR